MTDLQIGFIVAGFLLIIGIYCLTKIQERRIQKKEEALYRLNTNDALMDAFSSGARASGNSQNDPLAATFDEDAMPIFSEKQFMTASPVDNAYPDEVYIQAGLDDEPVAILAMPEALDPRFDYICGLVASAPISGRIMRDAMKNLSLSKPLQWVGTQAGSLKWSTIEMDQQYQYICIGLQLVDRTGALSQAELDTFLVFVQNFAGQAEASVDIPDTSHVIERAQALDAFCAEVDVQIGINIVANAATYFAGTKIRSLAEASGCILQDDGCFYRIDLTTAGKLFVLYNLGDQLFALPEMKTMQTSALGLIMDLPLVADGVLVFNQMLLFARQLSQTLDGRLVDANEQPLTDKMIDNIRRQIVVYQGNLRERGIAPGSPLAARLFH